MKKSHLKFRFLVASLVLIVANSNAHDFWLEAHPFYTEPGDTVDLSVHVGNHFVGDSLPNIAGWYSDFSLYQVNGKSDIQGEMGRDPAGYFTAQQQGTYNIGYQSLFQFTEIDPDTFNKYLHAEGLDNALKYRQQQQQQNEPGKERYIRHAKALIQSGSKFTHDSSMLELGYELELVPLQNPYRKSINDELEVRLLYQGQAAADIQVVAFSKQQPEQVQIRRSDDNGMVRFKLDQAGPWLIKAVKIVRLQQDKAEWQSHWASLTFAVK